jgi:hypothetical protein
MQSIEHVSRASDGHLALALMRIAGLLEGEEMPLNARVAREAALRLANRGK